MAGCFGQIFPTVPANIFRITLSNYSTIGEFKLKDQDFNMRGIGRSYFDDETKMSQANKILVTSNLLSEIWMKS